MRISLRAVAVAVLLLLFVAHDSVAAEEASVVRPREQDIMESVRGMLSLLQDLVARLLLFLPRCFCTNPLEMLRSVI